MLENSATIRRETAFAEKNGMVTLPKPTAGFRVQSQVQVQC